MAQEQVKTLINALAGMLSSLERDLADPGTQAALLVARQPAFRDWTRAALQAASDLPSPSPLSLAEERHFAAALAIAEEVGGKTTKHIPSMLVHVRQYLALYGAGTVAGVPRMPMSKWAGVAIVAGVVAGVVAIARIVK